MGTDRVRIVAGPLTGKDAAVLSRDGAIVRVSVELFGVATEVELRSEEIASAPTLDELLDEFSAAVDLDLHLSLQQALTTWWVEREAHPADLAAEWDAFVEVRTRLEREQQVVRERRLAELRREAASIELPMLSSWFERNRARWRPFTFGGADDESIDALAARAACRRDRERAAWAAHWRARPPTTPSDEQRAALDAEAERISALFAAPQSTDAQRAEHSKRELVDKLGRAAIEALLASGRAANEAHPRVIDIADAGPGFPWAWAAALPPDAAIARIFEPIVGYAPRFVEALTQRTRALYGVRRAEQWGLLYLVDADDASVAFLVGGVPDAAPQLRDAVRARGWTLPEELRMLYRCHGGFGAVSTGGSSMWSTAAILPPDRLSVLGELLGPTGRVPCDEPETYRFDDLLGFYQDGAGNSRNFLRRDSSPAFVTVQWDHETRDIGPDEPFWAFLDAERLRPFTGYD